MNGLLIIRMIFKKVPNFNVVIGTVPKSNDFNNYIRRRLTLINADATLNQRKSV